MAQTIATLLVKIGVEVKEMNKGLRDVERKLKKTEKGFGLFGAAFLRLSGVISAGLIAKKIFTETANFQEALSKLGAATNTTGKELVGLGQEAIKLSNQFGVSTEEIIHGMQTLKNLGLSSAEALEALPAILKTVIGVGADFETTAAVMETVLNDFNKTAKDSVHITDVLIETMRQGNFDIQAWREAMKEAGSAASSANATFEDVATSLILLGKAGITGGRAGTALRNIFLGINKQIAKGAPLFKEYGIEIQNSDGTFKSFSRIISEVQEKFKTLTPQQKTAFEQALVGKEAYSALDTIINRAPESFDKLTASIKKSGDQTEKSAQAQLNTINGQVNRTKSLLNNLAQAVGGSFEGIATQVLKGVNVVLEVVTNVVKNRINTIKANFEALKTFLLRTWNSIVQGAQQAWSRLSNTIGNLLNNIRNQFTRFVSGASRWGRDMVNNFSRGISSAWGSVTSKVRKLASTIASYLHFSSPDKGPLAEASKWMPDFMNLLAKGIEMGIPKLQMAVGDVSSTLADVPGISNNNTVNNNVSVYPRHATLDARGLNRELERMRFLNGGAF
jgi:TP901 family phage tail tape measure protein